MGQNKIEIKPLSNAVGAEIYGVNVGCDLDNCTMTKIRQAFFDHGVVFFMDQDITPEQQLVFARRFGPIDINRFFTAIDGYPEIAEVRKEAGDTLNIGGAWHADHSYNEQPALGSMLYAKELPQTGGDTMFASMYAAYDALSPGMKEMLNGLFAVHSAEKAFGLNSKYNDGRESQFAFSKDATNEVEHPVVCTYPETGRKYLYVNGSFTTRLSGMTQEESAPLLHYLYKHAVQPEFTCRFKWRQGSMAFWDNACTQHFAINDYNGQRRLMHRITIQGRKPQF